jgi:tRNA-modifying protein YgfZ
MTASPTALAHLETLLLSGADVDGFLQGQLSADIAALGPGSVGLAACNSAQGRVQAVTWLVRRTDGIALIVSRDMTQSLLARLRKYVLRSKVTFASGGDALTVATLPRSSLPAGLSPTGDRWHSQQVDASYLTLPGHDEIVVLTRAPVAPADLTNEWRWRLATIRAGLPEIRPETHEAFVAQMLNLDLLGGIDFEKGCYTGQEIIARTHYRGAIKRRMFRFAAASPPPRPGTRIVSGTQHAGDVVDSASTEQGCELLAVISLANVDDSLKLESAPDVPMARASLPYAVE